MKKSLLLPFILIASLLLTHCAGKETQTGGTSKDSAQVVSEDSAKKYSDSLPLPEFIIVSKGEDEFGAPRRFVILNMLGERELIDSVHTDCKKITKEEFKQFEIPGEAIDACGGWWAGAGDYFYLIKANDYYDIYRGWQDEGQTDEGYHWQKFSTTNRSEIKLLPSSGR